jgi:hypothetical protein
MKFSFFFVTGKLSFLNLLDFYKRGFLNEWLIVVKLTNAIGNIRYKTKAMTKQSGANVSPQFLCTDK